MSGIVLVFVVPALVGNDIAGELAVRFVVRHAVKRDVEVARTGGGASGSAFGSVDVCSASVATAAARSTATTTTATLWWPLRLD